MIGASESVSLEGDVSFGEVFASGTVARWMLYEWLASAAWLGLVWAGINGL